MYVKSQYYLVIGEQHLHRCNVPLAEEPYSFGKKEWQRVRALKRLKAKSYVGAVTKRLGQKDSKWRRILVWLAS